MDKRIINDLQESYGIRCRSFSRINGGFLNELWRVQTDCGEVLVKIFSPKRFSEKKLADIERALLMQQKLHAQGVCCPRVHAPALRRLDAQTAYAVTDYCTGRNETPETISASQLRSLGAEIARMHAAFDKLPCAGEKGYPVDCAALSEGLSSHMAAYGDDMLRRIAASWTAEAISRQPMALRHEDMTQDNVLFDDAGVTAIIDFDRACYHFALHDIGRAVLSFARTENGLRYDNVRAFWQGYHEILPLEQGAIVQALRVTWLSEAMWWIGPQAERLTGKALRFREDLLWLTEHYFTLEKIDALQVQGL
ncbi:MAG: phosphotransferase [Clostridia bacterium]|nr:phosphotransferase [Clostridia bacterium]